MILSSGFQCLGCQRILHSKCIPRLKDNCLDSPGTSEEEVAPPSPQKHTTSTSDDTFGPREIFARSIEKRLWAFLRQSLVSEELDRAVFGSASIADLPKLRRLAAQVLPASYLQIQFLFVDAKALEAGSPPVCVIDLQPELLLKVRTLVNKERALFLTFHSSVASQPDGAQQKLEVRTISPQSVSADRLFAEAARRLLGTVTESIQSLEADCARLLAGVDKKELTAWWHRVLKSRTHAFLSGTTATDCSPRI